MDLLIASLVLKSLADLQRGNDGQFSRFSDPRNTLVSSEARLQKEGITLTRAGKPIKLAHAGLSSS